MMLKKIGTVGEKTYTKADVMRALALVGAPCSKVPEATELEKDVTLFKAINLGANLLAEAVIEGLDEEEVGSRKFSRCLKLALSEMFDAVRKGAKIDLGGDRKSVV